MLQVIIIENDSKNLKDKSILRYLIKFFIMLDAGKNFISARQIQYMTVFLEADRNNLKGHECVQTQISVQPRNGILTSPISHQKPQC